VQLKSRKPKKIMRGTSKIDFSAVDKDIDMKEFYEAFARDLPSHPVLSDLTEVCFVSFSKICVKYLGRTRISHLKDASTRISRICSIRLKQSSVL